MAQRQTPQQKRAAAQRPQAAPGAPGQGTGGQKAAGTPSPPKQKQNITPKLPKGAPGQGAGGSKGAATAPGNVRPLTHQQNRQLAKAQQSGNEAQYLAAHPGVAKHQQKIGATPGQPAAAPGTGAPAQGAGGNKSGAQPPAGTNASAPPAAGGDQGGGAAPTVQDILNKQYGSNAASTFQQDWYGGNPLTTASNAAQRLLSGNLADVRNRYAQSGFGSSGREALAEGQATGDVATNLGAQLAQLGVQQKGSDLDRLANMFATAGQQDIQGKQVALDANQQLANLGTGVTGIGAQEQGIPNLDFFGSLLANMSRQPTYSQGAQKQPRK